MNKLIGVASALVLFAACGQTTEDACNEYIDAYSSCATAYIESLGLEDTGAYDLTGTCDAYSGTNNADSTSYFNCLTDYYSSESCDGEFPTGFDCAL